MKKILILFVLLALFSCDKKEYCWKCMREMRAVDEYYSRITQECGMTVDEARAYEMNGTYSSTMFVVVTTCTKE